MTDAEPRGPLRTEFAEELEEIVRRITRLAAHVTEAIPRTTEALLENDLQTAQAMIDHDDEVDALAIDIEEQCYRVLALQAPVASDLRAIIAAIRLVSEIERSADLMVNVCKATRRIYPAELSPPVRGLLEQMSEQATRLFRMCMDAYVDRDAALAAALDDIDDRLDELHADYVQAVLRWGSEQGDIQPAVQLALIGRYYERVGDHAVNIGERVRYMVDGWLPEHTGAARAEARKPTWVEAEPDDREPPGS
ncbi:MAG: phosphate signaling complex protein PhoU [Acidimicrobiales bacterium]|nr:phosphate signaling complex protein PhoU [Acidimicrobiales bacterium]